MRITTLTLLIVLGFHSASAMADGTDTKPLTVFAAASLTDALKAASHAFTESRGIPVRLSFAASSTLARQIEAGARADVYLSADVKWMSYLEQRNRIQTNTRRDLLGNTVVLIAPVDSRARLTIANHFPLRAALGDSRLAIAEPNTVPAGRYARAALTSLGVWQAIQSRLVPAENVRVALAYVARGEAAFGVVYRTDALIEKRVRIVDTFPSDSYPPIVYPATAIKDAAPAAITYLDFLQSNEGMTIFRRYGFSIPPAKR